MKKHKISTQLAFGLACIVFAVVLLISISANILIRNRFSVYMEKEQERFSTELSENLAEQYDPYSGTWNMEYIHGVGMYVVNDGYFLKIKDSSRNMLWDIEQHDMQCCHEMMDKINSTMERLRNERGEFVPHEYPMYQNDKLVGYAEIVSYSPYYINENAFRFLDSLNLILLITGAISLIWAVIAGILFARRITRPVASIIAGTKQIAGGQYENVTVPKATSYEMTELGDAVASMADTLKNQDRLRKQLTSDVAHELRTPLTNIASHLEMIIEGIWQPTTERMESCYEEIIRITSLVDDMEKLHKIDEDNLILCKERFTLRPMLETVMKSFEKELSDKNMSCNIRCGEISLYADKNRMIQVLTNLISNGVKYSEQGGEISVSAEFKEGSAVLEVRDSGIGISEDDLPHIFDRFYRADKSRNRSTGGAGIGLEIVKSIVEAHNGSIKAESTLGIGSRFIIEIPQ